LEDLNVDDRIMSKWVLRKRDERVYWIDVAEGVDKRRAVVCTVMNREFL
jgi:hypothetical protein